MLNRIAALALLISLCSCAVLAQKKPGQQNDRTVLEQILQQTYQPSVVGKQMLGIGGETDIRRAGTIVVIQRPGLFGSLLHNEAASSSIDGLQANLFRGHKDMEVPAGERYYVTAIAVGSDTILVALISARSVSTQAGTGRLWTTLSFKFPAEVLAKADKETVFREFDQWFVPEGRGVPVAAQSSSNSPVVPAAVAVSQPVAAPQPASAREVTLTPGMSREEVLRSMGNPNLEVSLEERQWLVYTGVVAALRNNQLESVNSTGKGTTRVKVQSDPAGAEIYLDEQLVGSTPSTLLVAPGKHSFRLHAAGHSDWSREVNILASSDISLSAKFE